MPEEPDELIEFLAPYPANVQDLTLAARLRLIEILEPASEVFWDATQAVCDGFHFTHNPRDSFVNLAVYPDHVTLIFGFGARLKDPDGLLTGSGKQVRHVRLSGIGTLDDPAIVDLILQAQEAAKRPPEPLACQRFVRVMNGPKRRPNG